MNKNTENKNNGDKNCNGSINHKGLKKLIISFFILQAIAIALLCISIRSSHAETIENITKETKQFDDWTVVCNKDVMMDEVRCRVGAKFYNNTSSVFVQPDNKLANHVVFIIPTALKGSIVKIKVGTNDIVESDEVEDGDFAVIPMKENLKKKVLEQMKAQVGTNSYLYIRFYIRDTKSIEGKREITERIALSKFNDMLNYYYSQVKDNKPQAKENKSQKNKESKLQQITEKKEENNTTDTKNKTK
jgi:hypothetical protein